jgi:hypothetical protein
LVPDLHPIWHAQVHMDSYVVGLCSNLVLRTQTSCELNVDLIKLLVWPVPLAQVLSRPQLIFPSKTWFFGIYLSFQWQKSLKNQYLSHSESKTYPHKFH